MDIITLALSKKYADRLVGEKITTLEFSYVFDTYEELTAWIAIEANTAQLKTGANLYIRDLNVPDYWWDGTQIQQLETQKVDLTAYAKTVEVENMLKDYTKTVDMDSILTAYAKTTEVDEKLVSYATTTNVNNTLTAYAKTTEVEQMIADAIGIALGGEY